MAEKIALLASQSRGAAAPAPLAFPNVYPGGAERLGCSVWEMGSHTFHHPCPGGMGAA